MSNNTNYTLSDDGVVIVEYEDLVKGADLAEAIELAFGNKEGCLGIIVVNGVPGLVEKRARLLPLASEFAALPDEAKAKCELKGCNYSFGWSHGRESFNGVRDTLKGSYYANPQYDVPTEDEELQKSQPNYLTPNVWPKDDLPDLEHAFKDLGQLVVDVGAMVAKHCDDYIARQTDKYTQGSLEKIVKESVCCKARLLHYFPAEHPDSGLSEEEEQWCGVHLDHSALTGLVRAAYQPDGQSEEVASPDPEAGLYIKGRQGDFKKVSYGKDQLAFQCGQVSQILSGGRLEATPHYVRGAKGEKAVGVSRNTLAVFMQPNWDYVLNVPEEGDDTGVEEIKGQEGKMDFSQFTDAVLAKYYDQEEDK